MPTLADYWRIKRLREAGFAISSGLDEYDGPSNPFDLDRPS